MSRPQYVAALDVGTSKIAAAVAEVVADDDLNIIGIGMADAKGIRRGVVVDLPEASASVARAIGDAELVADTRIRAVHVGLSGSHVTGFNSRGVVSVAGSDRVITIDDVRRAIDAATAVPVPGGREIVHVLPQDYVVDGQDSVPLPVGMTGMRLEANVYVMTANVLSAQNLLACVHRTGRSVVDAVLDPLAASEAVLTADEKAMGAALVDIGGGTTEFAIFERGVLVHAGIVPIGGNHLTNAVAIALRTPLPDAETLKRRSGWAIPAVTDDEEMIEVASLGSRPPRRIPQRTLSEILERQACELFEVLYEEISDAGFGGAMDAGLVLTGGGSILGGMPRVAERVFGVPVRRGSPAGVAGLTDHVHAPALATVVGLIVHACHHPVVPSLRAASGPLERVASRLRCLLSGDRSLMRVS